MSQPKPDAALDAGSSSGEGVTLVETAGSQTESPPSPQSENPNSRTSAHAAGLGWCDYCQSPSQDRDFCDHCNRELTAVAAFQSVAPCSVTTPFGEVDCRVWQGQWPDDPQRWFLTTLETPTGTRSFRVYGIDPQQWHSMEADVRQRADVACAALPAIQIVVVPSEANSTSAEVGTIVLAETRSNQHPPEKDHPQWSANAGDWAAELAALIADCRILGTAMSALHEAGLVWLEFDPSAIECSNDETVAPLITNMDLRACFAHQVPMEMKVSPRWSPPEVCRFLAEKIGPASDVYQLAMYAYFQLARMSPAGFHGRGLEAFAFDIPPLRIFRPDLPAGIWPVLQRALAVDSANRHSSPLDFVSALEAACSQHVHPIDRQSSAVATPTSFDVGGTTVAGKAKSALGTVNQDAIVIHRASVPRPIGQHETACANIGDEPSLGSQTVTEHDDYLLLIVADGVTTAKVGSGDLASTIACRVIEESIRNEVARVPHSDNGRSAQETSSGQSQFDWTSILTRSCQAAGNAIVEEALRLPNRPLEIQDNDLMSTTALVGVVQHGMLHLVSVGDSRAYLVSATTGLSNQNESTPVVEQLTVDGDVASSCLAEGVPPEQVREMGVVAKSLRTCLGAARFDSAGNLVADSERSRPQISHWKLRSDQIIVLCTDGLVDEGVFLEPHEMAALVHQATSLDAGIRSSSLAQEMAERLVAAADAKQRLPSPAEPNGFGDNISCIVLIPEHPVCRSNGLTSSSLNT